MTMRTMIQDQIRRAAATVRQAFRGSLGRVQSSTPIQLVALDGLSGESLRDVEQFQEYGFTSNPPAGTVGIAVPLGGRTSHAVVIATEHGVYRLQALKTGEVALYSDEGSSVVLRRGRVIESTCDVFRVNCQTYQVQATVGATFTTPELTASQQLKALGKITGQDGLAVSGGEGVSVVGLLHATDDVTAGDENISLVQHPHMGVHGKTGPALPE